MGVGVLFRGRLAALVVATAVGGLPPAVADNLDIAEFEPLLAPPTDAGQPDAGQPDAGQPDAGGAPEPAPAPAPAAAARIRLRVDVAGELFAPAGRGAPPVRQPITMAARFDFLEQPVAAGPAAVVRRYADATAALTVSGSVRRTALAGDAREVHFGLAGKTPAAFLADGFLSRDEFDLLDTPFDPLLLDSLRPSGAVAGDERRAIDADATAGLLAIDTVESGALEYRLVEVADGRGTFKLAGVIDGAVDGVPTHLIVEGSWSQPVEAAADEGPQAVRIAGPMAGIDVVIRERREASHVAPGFDIEAHVAMARVAVASPTPAKAAGDHDDLVPLRRRGAGRPGAVWHREAGGRYDMVHDARWRVIEDGAEGLVMRLVDHGVLAGQCSITALPRAALAPPTVAEVERDVERSLEGQFGRFESSTQSVRDDGVHVVQVVAAGRADGLPFHWIHYVLSDAAGRRLAATFMVEEPLLKRFAAADRELIDGLRLPAAARGEESPAAARQARLPSESSTP